MGTPPQEEDANNSPLDEEFDVDENMTLGENISTILRDSGCEIKRCDENKNVVGDANPDEFGKQVEQTQRHGAIAKELSTYTPQEKMDWAIRVKDKANECYYKRQIKEATEFYVDALIALDLSDESVKDKMRTEVQLPVTTNLAACMLESGRNLRCAELANVAIGIDPTNYVAWMRKATAHFRLSDYDDALHDFKKALELLDDAQSTQAQRMMLYVNKIRRFLIKEKQSFRRTFKELKIRELYDDRDDWKPTLKKEKIEVDDSDEAIAKLLEKYRPLIWTKWFQSWGRCLKNACLCHCARRKAKEKGKTE